MNLRHFPVANALIVVVESPRLESTNAEEFRTRCAALVEAGHRELIFDLGQVEFMDSRGLGAMISVFKLVSPDGGVSLAGLRHHVADLFKLTRLDRIFPIFRDAEQAAQARSRNTGAMNA